MWGSWQWAPSFFSFARHASENLASKYPEPKTLWVPGVILQTGTCGFICCSFLAQGSPGPAHGKCILNSIADSWHELYPEQMYHGTHASRLLARRGMSSRQIGERTASTIPGSKLTIGGRHRRLPVPLSRMSVADR
jgi:hypothetical protein